VLQTALSTPFFRLRIAGFTKALGKLWLIPNTRPLPLPNLSDITDTVAHVT